MKNIRVISMPRITTVCLCLHAAWNIHPALPLLRLQHPYHAAYPLFTVRNLPSILANIHVISNHQIYLIKRFRCYVFKTILSLTGHNAFIVLLNRIFISLCLSNMYFMLTSCYTLLYMYVTKKLLLREHHM